MGEVAVIQYPGSNCDLDTLEILRDVVKARTDLVWHKDLAHDNYEAYVLPGGFSYGDYLRAGAIAATSPSLRVVKQAAEGGKPVLGVCNGFQILVEAGLLPGALLRNSTLRFVCRWVHVRVENDRTPFTKAMTNGQVLRMPIAHNEGKYYAPERELKRMLGEGRAVFRYCSGDGRVGPASNPTGTLKNIAGVCNKEGNVVGLMPHPERASERILSPFGSDDGKLVFESLLREA